MRSQFVAALLLLASPVLSAPAPGKDSDCEATVRYGQGTIQQAIDKAKRGDRIVVEAGTYAEQLTITTDGIQLIGKGAKLVPPKPYQQNFCSDLTKEFPGPDGTRAQANVGICIYGKGTKLLAYVDEHARIDKYGDIVNNVVITGFDISGFNGANIAVIAGQDVKIRNNKLTNGGQYGFLTVGSKDTVAKDNVITHTEGGFIAMCQDDKANAKFIDNNISNYFIALCGQTSGGLFKKNTIKDCCIGPFIDPGKKDVRVIENKVSGRGKSCPPAFGAGIIISGAKNTLVKGNIFENINNNSTGQPTGVGAYIATDDKTGEKAEGYAFLDNIFRGNDFDIFVANNSQGVFKGNKCAVGSFPDGLCAK